MGVFDPVSNKDRISKISENNINVFSLELLPRITQRNRWIYYPLRPILLVIKL